jgi:uncharacterized protein GlcG (DUF336 family)
MIKSALTALLIAASASTALAQAVAPRPVPTPPRGDPPLALALEAVQTALAACEAKNYKASAMVVDYHGSTIALLSSDGASYKTPELAGAKAATTMKYKVASGEIQKRAIADAAFAAEVAADPKIGAAHQGALPIMVGGKLIGAIAVSGATGGENDEACAQAGLDKIASRLR